MSDEQHNKYIAYAFAAHGAFQLLMGIFIGAMFFLFLNIDPSDGPPPAFLFFMFAFMFFFQALFAAPSFVATYALLKKKPWARVSGIVAAVLSAMNVPIGTVAAVYALWFFCGESWKSVYPETAMKGARSPLSIDPASEEHWGDYARQDDPAFVFRTPPPPDWR
jgi:hypothetical protein